MSRAIPLSKRRRVRQFWKKVQGWVKKREGVGLFPKQGRTRPPTLETKKTHEAQNHSEQDDNTTMTHQKIFVAKTTQKFNFQTTLGNKCQFLFQRNFSLISDSVACHCSYIGIRFAYIYIYKIIAYSISHIQYTYYIQINKIDTSQNPKHNTKQHRRQTSEDKRTFFRAMGRCREPSR